ncbi:hypothetical protein C3L33_03494, partial [Rhododendron williamsianum]
MVALQRVSQRRHRYDLHRIAMDHGQFGQVPSCSNQADVELEGYLVPKDALVNFLVADIGCNPKVWDEPLVFKPERFFINTSSGNGEAADLFDITGSREIKMMPFGEGRRICPAIGLALLHLELFVANLVWYFEWKTVGGNTVDLSEKQEFITVMKYPLRAHISPRGFPGK